MERRQTRREEAASAYWVMEFVADQVKDVGKKLSDLARDMQTRAHTHTQRQIQKPTQIDPDIRPCAVTFYLSILFIIVWQCKRQTGKGYDVTDQEFAATKWSGITSSGGHFSCGVCVCVYIFCVFWTLFQAKTAVNLVIVLSWF